MPALSRSVPWWASLALCTAALPAQAAVVGAVTDTANDFLASYAGVHNADLDVIAASAVYNERNDTFTLSARMAGNIGTTSTGFYVWGVNRGAGTAGFAAIGATQVLFDSVVLLRQNGTSNVAGTVITIAGDTITGVVSGATLTSTGFAKADYAWNLWPRDGISVGTAAISDFAPDNATFANAVVPEPGSLALAGLALGMLGWRRYRLNRQVVGQSRL